eukprot:gene23482-29700_t
MDDHTYSTSQPRTEMAKEAMPHLHPPIHLDYLTRLLVFLSLTVMHKE